MVRFLHLSTKTCKLYATDGLFLIEVRNQCIVMS